VTPKPTYAFGRMRSRSKPVALHTLRNRGGSISYLVCGTLAPRARQRKARFSTLEDAIATQEAWEAERIGTRAALRPKITRLSQPQLAQAEAAFELLKGTNLSLVDAVRHAFRHPPTAIVPKKLGDALQQFLSERRPFIGDCHYENLRLIGEHMTRFLGPKTLIGDITTQDIVRWLESKGQVSKRTWNG
jgi:hypothetical protein